LYEEEKRLPEVGMYFGVGFFLVFFFFVFSFSFFSPPSVLSWKPESSRGLSL